jgi:hypothetical protein
MENTLTPSTETAVQRFEPNPQMVWGAIGGIGIFAGVVLAAMDYFKLAPEPSFARAVCVFLGTPLVVVTIFWFRAGRHGCQSLLIDASGLTLETKSARSILPWNELSEIILAGDSVLKFVSRNAREPLRLDNLGFTPEQWKQIKSVFESRGYQLKIGYSAL